MTLPGGALRCRGPRRPAPSPSSAPTGGRPTSRRAGDRPDRRRGSAPLPACRTRRRASARLPERRRTRRAMPSRPPPAPTSSAAAADLYPDGAPAAVAGRRRRRRRRRRLAGAREGPDLVLRTRRPSSGNVTSLAIGNAADVVLGRANGGLYRLAVGEPELITRATGVGPGLYSPDARFVALRSGLSDASSTLRLSDGAVLTHPFPDGTFDSAVVRPLGWIDERLQVLSAGGPRRRRRRQWRARGHDAAGGRHQHLAPLASGWSRPGPPPPSASPSTSSPTSTAPRRRS